MDKLDKAILKTIAYVDIYDYPLTAREIRRYLIEYEVSLSNLETALQQLADSGGFLDFSDGYYALLGRGEIIETRKRRRKIASMLWAKATYFGGLMAKLPYVLMVSVTGSLAVDNADLESDIDFLIVTEDGRLWTTRAMIVLIVRLAAKRGVAICPNYLVTESAMAFQERNLYTAHEVAQMQLIAGMETYQKMREANMWVESLLPNAGGLPESRVDAPVVSTRRLRWLSRSGEYILRTPPGDWLESWEMNRKIRKLSGLGMGDETAFSVQWCKGHFENHGRYALEKFDDRWRSIENRPTDEKT